MTKNITTDLSEFNYHLPPEKIAFFPAAERDASKLLVRSGEGITTDVFRNIGDYLPPGGLLVFNNTRVIRARLLFRKESGAGIEVLCLEPLNPSDYGESFASSGPVEWKCIVGNLKKWKKGGMVLGFHDGKGTVSLTATKEGNEGEDAWRIRFSWNRPDLCFGQILEMAGHIPLPPYIDRADTKEDVVNYQTVYSSVDGSVAAPTAGLHFTPRLLSELEGRGIRKAEITLHVGAGTFKPVKTININEHEMHCEHFVISRGCLAELARDAGSIIAVGTTTVRTLESLYWMGVKVLGGAVPCNGSLSTDQWEPYEKESQVPVRMALNALGKAMDEAGLDCLNGSTSLIIVPGYRFRMIKGLVTNFHQPGSTLLLLVAAWTGEKWKDIYNYALKNNFRFLSYGDSSLLYR